MMSGFLAVALAAALLATAAASPTSAATDADVTRSFATTPADLQPVDVVFDSNSGLVLAITGGSDPTYPDSLVAFDPADGAVAWSVALGGGGLTLAVAADGSRAYVGVGTDIVEVDLSTRVTQTHDLGDAPCSARFARDIVVLPSDATSIVVASDGFCFDGEEVLRMTSGAIAADIVSPTTPVRQLALISDSEVIGYDETGGCGCHRRLSVDADGVEVISSPASGISSQAISAAAGIVYASNGRSVNAATGALNRDFGVGEGASSMPPLVDGEVVYVGRESDDGNSIDAYDTATGAVLGEPIWIDSIEEMEGVVVTPSGLVIWGLLRFLAEGEAPPPPTVDLDIAVGVDLLGTGYQIIIDDPIETCVEVWEVDTEELLFAVETFQQRVSLQVPQESRLRVLAWDCNRWGLFPTWYEDAILIDWDGATVLDMSQLLGASIRINMDPFFLDVPFEAYYFGPTVFLRNVGITQGCGSIFYCPGDDVTREQMAAFMARFWRLFFDGCSSPSPFGDVSSSSFAYRDVGCIAELGVTTGTSPTTYSPGNLVTREQMASFVARLYRAFGLECPDGGHPFTDVSPTSFANADIACIFNLGITTGTSATTYSPAQTVTRAQMAAFLDRLYDAVTA